MAVGDATMPFTASRESLSQLFREHHRRILTAAYRITGSMADAEDVTQAVFVRLVSGGGLPMTNAGSYLYRAAINGALDLLRRRKTAPTEPLQEAEGDSRCRARKLAGDRGLEQRARRLAQTGDQRIASSSG